ncbi:MAG: PQQ-binding-like beta-propeller repeat protein, partial [Candidatus Methanofastidiosia archaeon]
MKILAEVDREKWSRSDKFIRWGCYEPEIPDRYLEKGISRDFPKSRVELSPEEELGKKHLLWEVDLEEAIYGPPVYANGRVFVTSEHRLISFDAKTGEKLWEFEFGEIRESLDPHIITHKNNISIHEEVIYVSAPDFWVYSIDFESGDVIWKYNMNSEIQSLNIFENRLLIWSYKVICFERESGKKIWKTTDKASYVRFYGDKILFKGYGRKIWSYYALMDINSGKIIWKEKTLGIKYPVYYDGFLYFGKFDEHKLVSVDVEKMEEVWSYDYGKRLGYFEPFEDEILLLIFDDEEKTLDKLVFLDKNGLEIWEYHFPENIRWTYSHKANVEIFQDMVFLLRKDGFIEAFDKGTGEKLWKTEVRGSGITSFQIYEEKIHISASDGRLYCLELESGKVIWEFD